MKAFSHQDKDPEAFVVRKYFSQECKQKRATNQFCKLPFTMTMKFWDWKEDKTNP